MCACCFIFLLLVFCSLLLAAMCVLLFYIPSCVMFFAPGSDVFIAVVYSFLRSVLRSWQWCVYWYSTFLLLVFCSVLFCGPGRDVCMFPGYFWCRIMWLWKHWLSRVPNHMSQMSYIQKSVYIKYCINFNKTCEIRTNDSLKIRLLKVRGIKTPKM
jgi:hypothetical protein